MTETTRRVRATSVLIADADMRPVITSSERRQSRTPRPQSRPRRWHLWQDPQSRVCSLYAS